MKLVSKLLVLLLLPAVLAGGVACKRKPPEGAQTTASDSTLPGASEVIVAAKANDFEKAMGHWIAIRQKVNGNEQMTQFTILTTEFKSILLENESKNKKAAEVLANLRAISSGR